MESIVGGEEIAERIWVPDTYIYNEHSSQYKETYVNITSEGEVIWSRRLQLVFTEVSTIIIITSIIMTTFGVTAWADLL